jgi:hypothetical protein
MRVGRYIDDKVEWLGSLPSMNEGLGGSILTKVTGTWPDVDVHFVPVNGRVLMSSVYPLTGKGSTVTFGEGGATGLLRGVVRLDKTTLIAGSDFTEGNRFQTLRGPGLVIKPISAEKHGCDMEKMRGASTIALPFMAAAATNKGTLVTVGNLCDDDSKPAAEVWDQPGKSRFVELGHLVKKLSYDPDMLEGKGDELWIISNHPQNPRDQTILHYLDGKFDTLPLPQSVFHGAFVSAAGKLHVISKQQIVRYDGGKWTPIAKVSRNATLVPIVMDENETIWVEHGGIAKLREAREDEQEKPCPTPFVFLYHVSSGNANNFTFPSTRKALSTFPEVEKIKLMDYLEYGSRKLGVQVENEAQAEAVVKHIKENMKDEMPETICYSPTKPRIIDIKTGK